MKKIIRLFIAIFIICFTYGCIAGSYFIRFTQPDVGTEENIKFRFELMVNAGSAERAFKQASLFYRVDTDNFHEQKMSIQDTDDERVVFVTTLPAFKDKDIGKTIEYYFSFGNDDKTREYPFDDDIFYEVITRKTEDKTSN